MLASTENPSLSEKSPKEHIHQQWEDLSANLTAHELEYLDLLADLTQILGLEEIDEREIRLAMIERGIINARNERALLKLQLELDKLDLMSEQIDVDMERINGFIQELKDFNSINSPDANETINLKLTEYQQRLKNVDVASLDTKILEFNDFIEEIKKCGKSLDELAECKEFFAGLPPNLLQAQQLVDKEQLELDLLLAKRDQLLREKYPDLHRERRRK
jgi:hypothetical protein